MKTETATMPEKPIADTRSASLCEVLDRVLTKGVIVHGDITIAVADINLLYLGLRLMLTSIETARNSGIVLNGEEGLDLLCS